VESTGSIPGALQGYMESTWSPTRNCGGVSSTAEDVAAGFHA